MSIQFTKRSGWSLLPSVLILALLASGHSVASAQDATTTPSTTTSGTAAATDTTNSAASAPAVNASTAAAVASTNAPTKPEPPAPYAADWRVSGPTGGDVRALVVDPNDAQRFYFGTLDGQLYTSSDGGKQWSLLYNFRRPGLFVDHIIVDPRDSKTIYVASHRHTDAGGFFKTMDGGQTWRESAQLKTEALHSLAQSPSNPDVLVVGTNLKVFRSEDSGETWTQAAPFGTTAVESLTIDPRNPDVIYAGTWHLPYKTSDGGKSWRIIKTGIIDDSDFFAIDLDPRNPDHVIASACSGIYETRNGGNLWRKVQGIPSQSRRTRAILQHPTIPGLVFAGTTEGFWRSASGGADGTWMVTTSRDIEINSITVSPKNPHTIYISTNSYGVMVSNDDGKNFTPTNGGYSGRFANAIVADREKPGRVYATTINVARGGGFFFVSNDDGTTWQPSMRNWPNNLTGYSILQDEKDGNLIYLGTNYGVYRSLDRGASWSPIGPPKAEPVKRTRTRRGRATRGADARAASSNAAVAASAAASPRSNAATAKRAQEALNAAGYNVGTPDGAAGTRTVAAIRKFQADKNIPVSGKLDSTTLVALGLGDGGVTSPSTGAVPSIKLAALSDSVNALSYAYDQRDGRTGIFAATNVGLFRTYDPSQGWEKISFGSGLDTRTTSISTSAQNPKTVYVGTAISGLLVSRDGGATWQQVAGIPANAPISSIEQDSQRSAFIYVGTRQTLYVSHDGGEKWIRRGGNLPIGDYTSILVNPRNSDEVFVGNALEQNGGVYRSADAGTSWERVDPTESRLPSQRIWSLAFSGSQNRLFVGSHSAGIYVAERGAGAQASTLNQ